MTDGFPIDNEDLDRGHAALFDNALFDIAREPTVFLRDRYQEPPFTVLDRRGGAWQERDRRWKALGIQSEVGRANGLAFNMEMNYMPSNTESTTPSTSVFSPTLTELMVRWYSAAGDIILDPFAGGSVRGVVSSTLGREYFGVELREEQVHANRAQADIGGGTFPPEWLHGDAADLRTILPDGFRADMVLTCPPYAYLEEYSDDPRDLSSMDYPDFLRAYRGIIAETVRRTRLDRFIVWVVGEVRNKRGHGSLLGLLPDTIQAFRDAGAEPYNDHVILTPIGTAAVRTPKQFETSRKAGRVHEYCLVFVKGDARAATQRLGAIA